MKHFVCQRCGNLFATVNYTGKRAGCCGGEMEEIVPRTGQPGSEKHTPILTRKKNRVTVKIGTENTPHPMSPDHYISWVSLITDKGNQRKVLYPDSPSSVDFLVDDDEQVVKAFSFCNVHGLWVSECQVK